MISQLLIKFYAIEIKQAAEIARSGPVVTQTEIEIIGLGKGNKCPVP